MTAEEFVKDRYLKSRTIHYDDFYHTYYMCWTKSHDGVKLSEGKTKLEAWENAKKQIQNMDILRDLRIKEIDIKIKELQKKIDEKDKEWYEELDGEYTNIEHELSKEDPDAGYSEYLEFLEPEQSELVKLERERRKIQPYVLSEISDFGDVMSLKDFIGNVKCGGFIDYDGFGYYVKNGKESDIEIHPSDLKNGVIRDDEFTEMIWFNK